MSEQYERISISDLEIKGSRESGQVRSTCPHCRDYKQHGNAAVWALILIRVSDNVSSAVLKFLLEERVQKWQQHKRSFGKKKNYKRPSEQGLEKAYNGTLVDYVLKRGLDPQQCLSHGIFMAKRKFSGIERDCLAFAFYEDRRLSTSSIKQLINSSVLRQTANWFLTASTTCWAVTKWSSQRDSLMQRRWLRQDLPTR